MSNKTSEWLHEKFHPFHAHKWFDKVTGWISLLNPLVIAFQLAKVLSVENVEGVSIATWFCFIAIQITFGFVAIKVKNLGMVISMLLSVLISGAIIITTLIKS